MALNYYATKMGTITITDKGSRRVNCEIRTGNCMAVVIEVRKANENDLRFHPTWVVGKTIVHSLVTFYCDEQHLRNMMKHEGRVWWDNSPTEKATFRLNLYYKEMQTLAKYLTMSGYKVTCYWREPKKTK